MIAASGSSEAVSRVCPPASWLGGEACTGSEAAPVTTGMEAELVFTVPPSPEPETPEPFPPTSIFI